MKIVVGYDGSEHARRALERAAGLAHPDDRLVVVAAAAKLVTGGRGGALHVDPADLEERRRNLDEAAAFLRERGIEPEALVEAHGDPGTAILEAGEDAGLILVGTRGRNPVERLMLGSVSHKVVHRAKCDVLVVR